MKERDIHIDLLRTIGLFLVVLAHIPINETVKNIRSFDVMLLVFIAGISFVKSGGSSCEFDYRRYVVGRIKRLCFPTWGVLSFIFLLAGILCFITSKTYIYSARQIVESYLFIGGINGGIGNVWIVRIYLLMALLTPLFNWIEQKFKTGSLNMLLLGLLVLNELIVVLVYKDGTISGIFIENIINSILCYSVGFVLGMSISCNNEEATKKELILFSCVFLLSQVVVWVNGGTFGPNDYKYPPRMYYALYGIVGSLCLYLICYRIKISNQKIRDCIIWISKKSFDIYLSHTIVLKLLSWGDRYINDLAIFRVSILYYIFVMVISISLVKIKDRIKKKY